MLRAIGLMSGTSMDGIDCALIETDGETISAFGPSLTRPYAPAEQAILRRALEAAADLRERNARPGPLAEAEGLVTSLHAEAVRDFLRLHTPGPVDVAGFHGQTVLHRPDMRLTIQIGDGAALAKSLGIPVVHDFRAADVAAGGQGAPLVPVFHRALVANLERPKPVAVLNVGGVANLTWLGEGDPVAFDTGPGNALIDDFLRERTGAARDEGGAVAAQGKADETAVMRVLAHPFFARKPPKSLDRNEFREFVAREAALGAKGVPDGAATLSAITSAAVVAAVAHLPQPPRHWIVAGGGAHNATLMRMLGERLLPARVETASDVGWNADAIEAQAFAYLAVRSLRGLPISFPGTTGVPRPMTGGVTAQP